MKKLTLLLASAAMMWGASFTGTISDSGCKGDHSKMKMGDDAKCTMGCVKSMGAKYVLWDGKEAYTLSDQTAPEKFAGKKVTVMGTLDAKTNTIKVDSMAAAQ
jgi:hypothetical protein